jgi:hypothetical protein
LKVKTHLVKNQVLSFANGEQAPCNKEIQNVKLQIGEYVDNQVTLKVADLPHHDIILGKPWLERYNLVIDWVSNTLSLQKGGSSVKITSKTHAEKTGCLLISAIQAKCTLRKGKDEFLVAIIKDQHASNQDEEQPS